MARYTIHLMEDGDQHTPPTLPQGIFAKLLPDTQVAYWQYRCRSLIDPDDGLLDKRGYPQMVPFYSRVGTPMTDNWQWWCMNQQVFYHFGFTSWVSLNTDQRARMVRWYNSMYHSNRFITNNAGVDANYNAITGERKGTSLPRILEVACAVNVVELFSKEPEKKAGKWWYKIKTLDGGDGTVRGSKDPPLLSLINYRKTPQFVHVAVTWNYHDNERLPLNMRFTTGDFPQMFNVGYAGHSLYPNVSPNGHNWVEVDRVAPMHQGDPFPPFHFEI